MQPSFENGQIQIDERGSNRSNKKLINIDVKDSGMRDDARTN